MSVFQTTTYYKSGKKAVHEHVTGSGHLTVDQFKDGIERHNMFPGAVRVEIKEIGHNPAQVLASEVAAGEPHTVSPTSTTQLPKPEPGLTTQETPPSRLQGSPFEAAEKSGAI